MVDYATALRALVDGGVRFVLVGGAAATAHGSPRLTHDLDLLIARNPANLDRLSKALAPFPPPAGEGPLPIDAATLAGGSLTLPTGLGPIDLHGALPGGGSYEDLLPGAIEVELFGRACRCLDLPALIAVKRAGATRTEDLEALAELEALLEERQPAPPRPPGARLRASR